MESKFDFRRPVVAITAAATLLLGATGCRTEAETIVHHTPATELSQTDNQYPTAVDTTIAVLPPASAETPPITAAPITVINPSDARLSRCYDTPYQGDINELQAKASDAGPDGLPSEIQLNYDADEQHVEGDPVLLSEDVYNKVEGAVVAVEAHNGDNTWLGSGFIVQRDKQKYVVTAAHVAMLAASNSNITVTDNDGNQTTITGGCYVYDDQGKFVEVDPKDTNFVDTDVAILKLDDDIGQDSLQFSEAAPKRGDWVFSMNYQVGSQTGKPGEPGLPDTYSGIVALTPPTHILTAINGLKQLPLQIVDTGHNVPGSSGSVVINQEGYIVGMSVAGTLNGKSLSKSTLQDTFRVTVKNGPFDKPGFEVTDALLMDNASIQYALGSSALTHN